MAPQCYMKDEVYMPKSTKVAITSHFEPLQRQTNESILKK